MSLPLEGKVILVTRPRHQAEDLALPLEELGAEVLLVPVLEIAPSADFARFDEALRHLGRYDWVVLTSANGVEAVRARMERLGVALEELSARRLAVIGPATGEALTRSFRVPDFVPREFVSEAIAEGLGDVAGQRFLLARADIARKELAELLRAKGAEVDEVAAYRIGRPVLDQPLPDVAPDAITLTSSEAARATRDLLFEHGRGAWMDESALVCIGPITAATVREMGYRAAVVAETYTVPGLIKALRDLLGTREGTRA